MAQGWGDDERRNKETVVYEPVVDGRKDKKKQVLRAEEGRVKAEDRRDKSERI
jgi:hypothetical protein